MMSAEGGLGVGSFCAGASGCRALHLVARGCTSWVRFAPAGKMWSFVARCCAVLRGVGEDEPRMTRMGMGVGCLRGHACSSVGFGWMLRWEGRLTERGRGVAGDALGSSAKWLTRIIANPPE